MYAKIFKSMYDGTLRGKAHELLVFTNMLASCDRDGCVDKHPRAIADEVGLTVEQVRAAIDTLESPDPESRTPDSEGRRLARLDGHRAWGWSIINFAKYRAIRSEEDRLAQNRDAQARFRARRSAAVSKSKPVVSKVSRASAGSAHAEAEAEAETENRDAAHPSAPPAAERPARAGQKPRAPTDQPAHRASDPLWDAVAGLWFEGDVAKPHLTRVGKIVRDLRDLSATPEELSIRWKRIAVAWGSEKATPEAVVKHWCQFAHDPAPPMSDAQRRQEASDAEFFAGLNAVVEAQESGRSLPPPPPRTALLGGIR